jgi:hypothetical protein
MKKFALTLPVLFACIFTFGQEKKMGISLQLSSPSKDDINIGWYNIDRESIDGYNLEHRSYALGLLCSYNLKNEATLRLRLGFSRYYIDEYLKTYDSGIIGRESAKGKQTKIHIAPGIIWKIKNNKFDFYGGFELPINLHGEFEMKHIYSNSESSTGNIINYGEQTITIPSGFSAGLGAVMGFNYYPATWLSFGAEFSPSLLYAKLSGKTTSVVLDERDHTVYHTTYTQDEEKGFTFYEQRFSINLSVWF